MKQNYILYNPLADNGKGEEHAQDLQRRYGRHDFVFFDMTKIEDYRQFFKDIPLGDRVYICGGDGTLNRFINDTKGLMIKHKLYYYACGSGNDFVRDLVKSPGDVFQVNGYLRDLPVVTVKGKEYLFLNNVGFGIDGYCCEVGDKLRKEKPKKKINYTAIAVKGLLFHYKPTKATVIVDGKEYNYKKVWLAPTMNGRYYGEGMMPTPHQRRTNAQRSVSLMVLHGSEKLKTLKIFPSIFKGTHTDYPKNVRIFSGHNITVKFDKPRTLQIDGETITDVSEYTVKSAFAVSEEKRKQRMHV